MESNHSGQQTTGEAAAAATSPLTSGRCGATTSRPGTGYGSRWAGTRASGTGSACWPGSRTGCYVAERGGAVIATATSTVFTPRLAWVGMMLVDPACRRQGLGRTLLTRVLRWLEGPRGVACVGLDATPLGKLLYDTMDFRDEYTLQRLEGVAPAVAAPADVRPPTAADIPRPATLDQATLGVDRLRLLRDLFAAHPPVCHLLERAGTIQGYVLIRPGACRWYLGPLVATDPDRRRPAPARGPGAAERPARRARRAGPQPRRRCAGRALRPPAGPPVHPHDARRSPPRGRRRPVLRNRRPRDRLTLAVGYPVPSL